MRMHRVHRIMLVAFAALLVPGTALFAQAAVAAGATGTPVVVAVSIPPLEYFAKRVGGDRLRTMVLVSPGQNPHSYEPTPRQLASLAQASLWFTTNIEFEKGLVPKVAALYPKLRIVDTSAGIPVRSLEEHGHDDDAHGHDDHDEGDDGHNDETDHGHGAIADRDPHVWLGRRGSLMQAAAIRDALVTADPSGAAVYRKNYEDFARDVESVFASLASELASLRGRTAFVYHPAFGYFLDEFGIRQVAVETGGKEPTQKTLAALVAQAKEARAAVVFVQPQFPRSAARSIAAAIGGTVEEIDDLPSDWLGNLRRMGRALAGALR